MKAAFLEEESELDVNHSLGLPRRANTANYFGKAFFGS